MTFKIKTGAAKYITIQDWREKCIPMSDIDRPVKS